MVITTHTARITGPISYLSARGRRLNIPLGPCMVELMEGSLTGIVWGKLGQRSVTLPTQAVREAQEQGHLVLLDADILIGAK